MVVKILKEKLQQLPPLQIPSSGRRILQTNASDKYWGAVLFEEKDGKRYICGHKSERFSDAEIHYHSTFKEILTVKKAISKFEFHLIGHHFLVEMDMPSFPQMLKFKQKIIPNPQLLRWAEWFSKYSFDCKHIKDFHNFLDQAITKTVDPKLQNLVTILQWFFPVQQWKDMINRESEQRQGSHIIIIFYKPQCFVQYDTDAPWDVWPADPALLTPYHRSIMEALQSYKEKIPDPSEWSQSYQWEYNSASKLVESSITIEDEYVQTVQSLKRMHIEKMDPEEKYEALQLEI
ncbi:hypothetical protein V6N11_081734 [Hibiscus sabdariffa]|uniref:Reverse transcriptase RNase H-like domain-containing protein n=1 Tax=Hibiscus sabdariffa TaxID=183260 RepID=A0ABR2Q705_9ROSI